MSLGKDWRPGDWLAWWTGVGIVFLLTVFIVSATVCITSPNWDEGCEPGEAYYDVPGTSQDRCIDVIPGPTITQ